MDKRRKFNNGPQIMRKAKCVCGGECTLKSRRNYSHGSKSSPKKILYYVCDSCNKRDNPIQYTEVKRGFSGR